MHRGPYKFSDETRRLVVCEKWVESLQDWVPFAALIDGVDDDPHDEELSEDIWNKWQRREIVIAEPDPQSDPVPEYVLPIQFRRELTNRGLRQAFEDFINAPTTPLDVRDEFEYGLAVERHSPSVVAIAETFDWTGGETDEFFRHAAMR